MRVKKEMEELGISSAVSDTLEQVLNLQKKVGLLSRHIISTRQKDKSAKRGLFMLVGRRNRLMRYGLRKGLINSEDGALIERLSFQG